MAKWLNVCLRAKWLWDQVLLQSLKLQISWLFRARSFIGIQANIECGFTFKCLHDMRRTYSQIHGTDNYSQHISVIWRFWLNGWLLVNKLGGFGFESRCIHLNFRYCTCVEKKVLWHSAKYRVRILSETRTRHDKNIYPNKMYWQVLTKQLNRLASWAKWLSVRLQNKFLCGGVSL